MPRYAFCSACGDALPHSPPIDCARCGTGHWIDARPCAGALVTRAGKLLLVRRAHDPWRDAWDVPGGFCHAAEHPIEAAEREVREETGLAIRVTGFLGMWTDSYSDGGSGDADKVTLNIYYHARPARPARPASDPAEVAEMRWFSAGELPERIAFPGHVRRVLAAWRKATASGQLESPLYDLVPAAARRSRKHGRAPRRGLAPRRSSRH